MKLSVLQGVWCAEADYLAGGSERLKHSRLILIRIILLAERANKIGIRRRRSLNSSSKKK